MNAITKKLIDYFNPATGDTIGHVEDGGAEAVDRAVKDAARTFENAVWRGMPPTQRAKILWRMGELLEANISDLAREEATNCGMPVWLGEITIRASADAFRYYSGAIERIAGQSQDVYSNGQLFHAYTRREPLGVAGLITPWNVPILIACMKLAPALAAGCSIVIKPSEETPLTTIRIAALLQQAGVPDGVVNVITGYGHTTGAALVEHPLVRKVSFTGSGEVGKGIVRAASGNLKRVTLELGGKSPVLIFDDADIKRASATAAWGIFTNTGQACVAGSRIFAEAKVYDQVVEGVSQVAKSMKIGNGIEKDTVLGPVISQKQMDRILGYIDEGRRDGAEVITGGGRIGDRGYFIEPTVMVNSRPEMALSREEIFGPVVTITKFEDTDEAIAEANNTEYGLSASVWTRDLSRAHLLASRLQAGTVGINSGHLNDFNMPFGGYKQSGWGRENGAEGINAFMESKSVFAALK